MDLQLEIKLIDDLVKENPDHTIKDFIEIRDEIENIINDNQGIGIKGREYIREVGY